MKPYVTQSYHKRKTIKMIESCGSIRENFSGFLGNFHMKPFLKLISNNMF